MRKVSIPTIGLRWTRRGAKFLSVDGPKLDDALLELVPEVNRQKVRDARPAGVPT